MCLRLRAAPTNSKAMVGYSCIIHLGTGCTYRRDVVLDQSIHSTRNPFIEMHCLISLNSYGSPIYRTCGVYTVEIVQPYRISQSCRLQTTASCIVHALHRPTSMMSLVTLCRKMKKVWLPEIGACSDTPAFSPSACSMSAVSSSNYHAGPVTS